MKKVKTAQLMPFFGIFSPVSNQRDEAEHLLETDISKKAMQKKVLQQTNQHGACWYAYFKVELKMLLLKQILEEQKFVINGGPTLKAKYTLLH